MKFELSREDFELLLLALGIATGACREPRLANRLIQLADTINKGNPNWTPYGVPKATPDT